MLNAENYKHYADYFSSLETDEGNTEIKNADAWDYLKEHIPLFDCPDNDFLMTYYFRWWILRKHIHSGEHGRVITEFLPPVAWAGKYNTICMATPLHIDEARWLRDETLWQEYFTFWYKEESKLTDYSHSIPASALDACRVTGDSEFLNGFFDDMCREHKMWCDGFIKKYNHWAKYDGEMFIGRCECGLYSTVDDLEGCEFSAGWVGYRPYLSSCMYASCRVLEFVARKIGNAEKEKEYKEEADELRKNIINKLWNKERRFYTTLNYDNTYNTARELYGYTPWLYDIPTKEQECAWELIGDTDGFLAPAGMPFLEQSHPEFELNYLGHPCKWNGPSWPLATSMTLKAMIRLLKKDGEHPVNKRDFYTHMRTYVTQHRMTKEDGTVVPCIEEDLNPYTGEWISRTIRLGNGETVSTGRDYNHSSCNDLIITGICGITPSLDDTLVIDPLLPHGVWRWFCLDGISYHGHLLTVYYDEDGTRYGRGRGLTVLVDNKKAAESETLERLEVKL